ncbi:MAG: hypothetical protein ACR2PG_20165 [Hyphomicrobiaceae bacterium]
MTAGLEKKHQKLFAEKTEVTAKRDRLEKQIQDSQRAGHPIDDASLAVLKKFNEQIADRIEHMDRIRKQILEVGGDAKLPTFLAKKKAARPSKKRGKK